VDGAVQPVKGNRQTQLLRGMGRRMSSCSHGIIDDRGVVFFSGTEPERAGDDNKRGKNTIGRAVLPLVTLDVWIETYRGRPHGFPDHKARAISPVDLEQKEGNFSVLAVTYLPDARVLCYRHNMHNSDGGGGVPFWKLENVRQSLPNSSHIVVGTRGKWDNRPIYQEGDLFAHAKPELRGHTENPCDNSRNSGPRTGNVGAFPKYP
jgi:hypothetical protein